MTEKLASEIEAGIVAGSGIIPQITTLFVESLETLVDWHDGDKLVFHDTVEQLVEVLHKLPGDAKNKIELQDRLENDLKALHEIQSLYDKELEKIFGHFETRGMVVRQEAWEQYVAYLKTRFKREEILKEYQQILPVETAPEKKVPKETEIHGTELPPKTLVLTFDDGPHPLHTERILEILKKYNVKAIFFRSAKTLRSFKEDNTLKLSRSSGISRASGQFRLSPGEPQLFPPPSSQADGEGPVAGNREAQPTSQQSHR